MLKDMVRTTNGLLKQRDAEIKILKKKKQATPIKQTPTKPNIDEIEERDESSEYENKPEDDIISKEQIPKQPEFISQGKEDDDEIREDNLFFKRNYEKKIEQYYQNLENRTNLYNNSEKVKNALSPGYPIRWPKKSSKLEKASEDVNLSSNNELNVEDIIKNSIEKVKAKNMKYVN